MNPPTSRGVLVDQLEEAMNPPSSRGVLVDQLEKPLVMTSQLWSTLEVLLCKLIK